MGSTVSKFVQLVAQLVPALRVAVPAISGIILVVQLAMLLSKVPTMANPTTAGFDRSHSEQGNMPQNMSMSLYNAYPTREELQQIRRQLQIHRQNLNFAITGLAGSGKSSLINALRGIRNNAPGAARVGIVETTTRIQWYPDSNPRRTRVVWYDIPGAGTQNNRSARYFIEQGLPVFDFIIITVNDRITETDIDILQKCASLPEPIPTFVVRSKADQHVHNLMNEESLSHEEAHAKVIMDTRRSFQENLQQAGLDRSTRIYIVSARGIRDTVNEHPVRDAFDEVNLIDQLLITVAMRRYLEETPAEMIIP